MNPSVFTTELHWLEGESLGENPGLTWGVPWPRGTVPADSGFFMETQEGSAVPIQTWPTAYWPDGSLKWTAHALGTGIPEGKSFRLGIGPSMAPSPSLSVAESPEKIIVDTGLIRCTVARKGKTILPSIERNGTEILKNLELVCGRQDRPDLEGSNALRLFLSTGEISEATIERNGPVFAVVMLAGKHIEENGRAWLPFTLRLSFFAGSEAIKIAHTFIFDGNENSDFIKKLGMRFSVPLRDPLHDRHIRFAGEGEGLWTECVRELSGLRRHPGNAALVAQRNGKACPPLSEIPEPVSKRLDLVPAFGDSTLFQSSADSFSIKKRTKPGYCWVEAATGRRSPGTGYLGGPSGGVAFGIRDFWQRHPGQLDIRGADSPEAKVGLWLWAPNAEAMDMRFYHDGLGMDTFEKQLDGMEITYEDYEPGFSTPSGIARTSELTLWALPSTPSRERSVAMAEAVRSPAMLVCRPERYAGIPLFGGMLSLPDRSTRKRAEVEDGLDWLFEFYKGEIERRSWYGFWHYGDIMHTYDTNRHVWRYDVGGFAWDNSELSPDLWLWFSFLRTGRADIYRMAEAMTRHTGEVDAYHLGKFKGLGSRHNVVHWGCSAKQARISNALYRRFHYYLTADERTGDLMRETLDADFTLLDFIPLRKYAHLWPESWRKNYPAMVSVGTDWCTFAAAWLTEWERTRNPKYREKLKVGMEAIGRMPFGFYSADPSGYDPETGAVCLREGSEVSVSHLQAVFGAPELISELVELIDVPEFKKAWLQYCELYSAPPEDQEKALGVPLKGNNLMVAHSRLTAYAAAKEGDARLALRAWREFFEGDRKLGWYPAVVRAEATKIEGSEVLRPVEEAAWISTNAVAQWCLAAIQNLALIGEYLEK